MPFVIPPHRKVQPSGIITNGLIGRWPLDEGTGLVAADWTANGNDGSLVNMDQSSWVQGQGGQGHALYFSGSSQYVNIPNGSPLNWSGSITLMAWVRVPNNWVPNNNQYSYVVGKGSVFMDDFIGIQIYERRASDDVRVHFEIKINSNRSFADKIVPDDFAVNTWVHVTGTGSLANGLELYIDGISQASSSGRDVDLFARDWRMAVQDGPYNASYRNFNGSLDDVRIYDRILDPSEILLIATNQG